MQRFAPHAPAVVYVNLWTMQASNEKERDGAKAEPELALEYHPAESLAEEAERKLHRAFDTIFESVLAEQGNQF